MPSRTLDIGPVRLGRLPDAPAGTSQVASGWDKDTGRPLVFIRFGPMMAGLTVDAAEAVAAEVLAEVARLRADEDRPADA